MSGWIKLEKDRRDDPRVIRMARELRHAGVTHERFHTNAHVTLVLGCLDVLWCYADTHIREDDTLDLGPDEIDELVGLADFCTLMPDDWLEVIDAKRVKLPDFHTHNGTESRRKALAQKRSERYRNAAALQEVTQESRTSVTRASPDLDQDQTKTSMKKRGANGSRRSAPDWTAVENLDHEWWQLWIAHRRQCGKAAYRTTREAEALARFPKPIQRAAIEQSMDKGWTGLFPERIPNGTARPADPPRSRFDEHTDRLRQWLDDVAPGAAH